MEKTELKRKVKELVKQSLNAEKLDKIVDKICASGAIDLLSTKNDYRLPKQIVCAISKLLYWEYQPLSDDKKQIKEIKNIYRFI